MLRLTNTRDSLWDEATITFPVKPPPMPNWTPSNEDYQIGPETEIIAQFKQQILDYHYHEFNFRTYWANKTCCNIVKLRKDDSENEDATSDDDPTVTGTRSQRLRNWMCDGWP